MGNDTEKTIDDIKSAMRADFRELLAGNITMEEYGRRVDAAFPPDPEEISRKNIERAREISAGMEKSREAAGDVRKDYADPDYNK